MIGHPVKKYILFLGLLIVHSLAFSQVWKNLAPGLEYTTIYTFEHIEHSKIHAFRVDLARYRFSLAFPFKNQIAGNIESWVKAHQAMLGINGGFFNPQLQSLGLRINQFKTMSPLKAVSWWGVFYTHNHQARIVSFKQYAPNASIDFAIQSGPRLIINGRIPSLKPGVANRTALGITKTGKVIILVTDNIPLTMYELAVIMQKPGHLNGLDCKDALNLDGGTSTQMYAQINKFELDVPGLKNIADAVLLKPREKY